MKKGVKITLFVLAGILLVAAVYFTFFFYYRCSDLACFKSHQSECDKTIFIREGDEIDWKYTIQGKKDGNCEIDVEVLRVKVGTLDKARLQGKEMTCLVSLGSQNNPEGDISKCTGALKEEMQNMIIQRLHAYIVENVGEVGQELNEVF